MSEFKGIPILQPPPVRSGAMALRSPAVTDGVLPAEFTGDVSPARDELTAPTASALPAYPKNLRRE